MPAGGGVDRAASDALDDVTTYNLAILNNEIDVGFNFATNCGYIESNQSHFWGTTHLRLINALGVLSGQLAILAAFGRYSLLSV
jgi:hypothetical protein